MSSIIIFFLFLLIRGFKYQIISSWVGGIIIGRVVHFDINSNDPNRAMKFYQTVFGWTFTKWEGPFEYWLISTGNKDQPGIDGGLSHTEEPGMQTSITIDTEDIDKTIRLIKDNGGSLIGEKNIVPGAGYHVLFKDTEGNQLGAMQDDPNAGK